MAGGKIATQASAQASAQPHFVYSGFWKRFGAYIIDYIVTGVVYVAYMLAASMLLSLIPGGDFSTPIANAVGVALIAGLFAIHVLYFGGLEGSKYQATIGKMALGMKVVDTSGNRISYSRAVGRYLAKFLSAIILYIGFIMIGFTEKKQGLHDMIADTLVVEASSLPKIGAQKPIAKK